MCVGWGGVRVALPLWSGGTVPPLFRHAGHNFWWKVVNLMSSAETETRFIRQMVVKAIFVSEYGWKCTILHRKFKKFPETCGAHDARRRYYFFVPPLFRWKLHLWSLQYPVKCKCKNKLTSVLINKKRHFSSTSKRMIRTSLDCVRPVSLDNWHVERCVCVWSSWLITNSIHPQWSRSLRFADLMPLIGASCFRNLFQWSLQSFPFPVFLQKVRKYPPRAIFFELVQVFN